MGSGSRSDSAMHGDYDFTSRRVAQGLGEMRAALEKRLGLRFGAIIDSDSCPAASRLAAMALPIRPSPMKPSFML
jgi:hypothetical protein